MVKDIAIDESAELLFLNGDFVVKNSNEQHAVLIINTQTGAWKQHPLCGVGILNYSASSGLYMELRRSIAIQLEADGYRDVIVDLVQNGDQYNYYLSAERPE